MVKCLTEEDKALDLAGGDDRPDSEEVRVARDELKVLHEEKHKTQRVIATVQKELETAQSKTRKLAEVSSELVIVIIIITDNTCKAHRDISAFSYCPSNGQKQQQQQNIKKSTNQLKKHHPHIGLHMKKVFFRESKF